MRLNLLIRWLLRGLFPLRRLRPLLSMLLTSPLAANALRNLLYRAGVRPAPDAAQKREQRHRQEQERRHRQELQRLQRQSRRAMLLAVLATLIAFGLFAWVVIGGRHAPPEPPAAAAERR